MYTLDTLPDDILILIFKYLKPLYLGRLCQVCKTFNEIINSNTFWIKASQKCLATNQISKEICNRSAVVLTPKERCRISYNWKKKKYEEKIYFSQKIKYMPWMILDYNSLLLSKGNSLLEFKRNYNGYISPKECRSLYHKNNKNDICRFVKKEDLIFGGYRCGFISLWKASNGKLLFHQIGHRDDVNSVDIFNNILVSGSKDKNVKIWKLDEEMKCINAKIYEMDDWIWSLGINPSGEYVAIGTSGHISGPLYIYDMEGNCVHDSWNYSFLPGAGILDILWESKFTFLTTGYDSYIRLWDIRTGREVSYWEDPFNSTLYCLASDNLYTFVSGTANYGRVELWDRRFKPPVQRYFVNMKHSSPVYSVSFDACQLYAALDQSLHVLDFR